MLVRGINNLSDARYCAGMGAEGLIFTLDPTLPGARGRGHRAGTGRLGSRRGADWRVRLAARRGNQPPGGRVRPEPGATRAHRHHPGCRAGRAHAANRLYNPATTVAAYPPFGCWAASTRPPCRPW
ncbi:MAG: hypothetical protein WKG07_29825 [Hymenobacter sp.]